MKIYHQAGHNTNWNIESLRDDNTGDGIIFSPVHYARDRFNGLDAALKQRSIFDPQFYVPDSQKTKLQTYEFFPEKIASGFKTVDFEAVAYESARLCLQFQDTQGAESLICPARYFQDLITDFIQKQKSFTVEPFLAAYNSLKTKKKLFITLPITTAMTQDEEYRKNLLNWISSYTEISGVYYLNDFSEGTKQICDFQKLKAHLSFIKDLKDASLDVIVGYCNTESLLVSVLDPYAVTIGAYENTRMFSIDKFLEEESEKRGPAPRLYFPKLLNWMRYDTAIEIKEDHPKIWEEIYSPTSYSEEIFRIGARPHFSQPPIYKHHFCLITEQLKSLAGLRGLVERKAKLKEEIGTASDLYSKISASGVVFFDGNCRGEHLPHWNRLLNSL